MIPSKFLALDTETDGLNVYTGASIFSWATCDAEGRVLINKLKYESDRARLQVLLNRASRGAYSLVCHNLKFDLGMVQNHCTIPNGIVWHDTMIMSQLLNNTSHQHGLDYLAWIYAKYPKNQDDEVAAAAKNYGGYDKIPDEIMQPYQKADVERTVLLFQFFWPKIQADPLLEKDYWNEIELIKTTIDMERRGVMLHSQNTDRLLLWLKEEVIRADQDAHRYLRNKKIDGTYNLGSPKQLNDLLFKKLKYPVLKIKESGQFSTDKEVIFKLQEKFPDDKILDAIFRYRSYVKGRGTLNGYLQLEEDGIIHTDIGTNFDATGRENSRRPNLQNVSNSSTLKTPYPIPARECFRPRVGFIWLEFDYSGEEMRLATEVAQEPELIELFDRNGDPHIIMVEIVKQVGFDRPRKDCKNGQFSIIYGASDEVLAKTIRIPVEAAREVKFLYAKRFPKLFYLNQQKMEEARRNGYVKTMFGRKLYINHGEINGALNYVIQGTGAGIVKRAQPRIHEFIKKSPWKNNVFLLLPVHDQICKEYARKMLNRLEEFKAEIKPLSTKFEEIRVPLDIEWKMSTTCWEECK